MPGGTRGRQAHTGRRPSRRLPRRVLAALGTAVAALLLGSAPAQADGTGYRYWSFWQAGADGEWEYATQGPGTLRPADGDVLGFRFAVSVNSSDAHRPRAAPDFAAVCGDTPEEPESRRVALVVDFGVPEHAPGEERPPQPEPRTTCAQVADGSTAGEALAASAPPLRYNSDALLCAIAGYPSQGCGEQIALPQDGAEDTADDAPENGAADTGRQDENGSADPGGSDDGSTVAVLAGVTVVAVLAGAALWKARQRRP
ncbi:SCO2322 family protein [Streptomyces sp. ACA25]|uniref:SCO2322 family protein n=1 Tax=Streptomyces sp. ACA25 TaxID=3022596 RepID=UPI002307DCE3|nr:SCO2322 family protein [Streptomyces sp. ACA25]MDB1087783.1 SCO2322 family protein [Streptomyces sp. ACA25]